MSTAETISDEWTTRCLTRADHRALGYLSLAIGAALLVVALWMAIDSRWVLILFPLCVEVAVPGRARIGRQAYLEIAGSDRSYLRVSEMPERVREHVRTTGRLWMAGPDDRGRTAVITERQLYLILGRIVIR